MNLDKYIQRSFLKIFAQIFFLSLALFISFSLAESQVDSKYPFYVYINEAVLSLFEYVEILYTISMLTFVLLFIKKNEFVGFLSLGFNYKHIVKSLIKSTIFVYFLFCFILIPVSSMSLNKLREEKNIEKKSQKIKSGIYCKYENYQLLISFTTDKDTESDCKTIENISIKTFFKNGLKSTVECNEHKVCGEKQTLCNVQETENCDINVLEIKKSILNSSSFKNIDKKTIYDIFTDTSYRSLSYSLFLLTLLLRLFINFSLVFCFNVDLSRIKKNQTLNAFKTIFISIFLMFFIRLIFDFCLKNNIVFVGFFGVFLCLLTSTVFFFKKKFNI